MEGKLAEADQTRGMGVFERYLTLWVLLCIVAGVVLGKVAPRVATFLDGLAILPDGTAYGTDWIFSDSLYEVALGSGTATLVGSLGLGDVSAQSGLAFLGGTLYAITTGGQIYTINTSTGAASRPAGNARLQLRRLRRESPRPAR